MSIKELFKDKLNILVVIFFIIGIVSRIIGLEEYPVGVNVDESSAGYESYSIMNYGIDRNNKSFPVYLVSWGDGQNALYTYILMPFIYIFGLNEFAIRIPMAILGCTSLFVLYGTLKKNNKKIAIIGLGFLAICPWHIMKSRWGLESNLLPDLVLISICLLIEYVRGRKSLYLYLSTILISISAYSYAISWIFLPIFLIITFIYLIRKKYITLEKAFICMIISILIVLPLIIFFIINYFDLNEVYIGKITIPKLYRSRFNEVIPTETNILFQYLTNFYKNMKIIITQKDNYNYNALPFFGIMYIISLPFTLIGIYNSFSKRNIEKNILNIWFISAVIVLFFISKGNINKINIIIFPIILYTIIGIYYVVNKIKSKLLYILISIMYVILFCFFIKSYIKNERDYYVFCEGFEEPLEYANSLNKDTIYIYYKFAQPYIYTLFYNNTPVNDFVNSIQYIQHNGCTNISRVGKYDFSMPDYYTEGCVYIVPKYFEHNINSKEDMEFEHFYVLK